MRPDLIAAMRSVLGEYTSEEKCVSAFLAGIRVVRERPTSAMLDSGVAFALNVTLSGEYRWTDYVRDMNGAMLDALAAELER